MVEINIDPVGAAWHGGGVLLFGFCLIVSGREASNSENLISVAVSMLRNAITSNKSNIKKILFFIFCIMYATRLKFTTGLAGICFIVFFSIRIRTSFIF